MPKPMLVRHEAVEKTLARFRTAPHAWGKADCWQMLRFHLKALGHKVPRCRSYKTAIGAKRALKEMGFDTLEARLDTMLPRIAPAAMLPGDVGLMKGDEMFDAIVICVGQKVVGWHQDDMSQLSVIVPAGFIGAWSVA